MTQPEADREEQALNWVRRIEDRHFADWDGHLAWLEADPGNPELFDRMSLEMEEATRGLPAAGPAASALFLANDNEVPPRKRYAATAAGGAVAAGLAVLFLWAYQPGVRSGKVVATAPGTSREIALVDGSTVTLNGGSALRIDGNRSVALVDGEGFFQVAHHPDHPFRLKVGARVIEDVGTSFDVAIAPQTTRIAVRDGAVAVDPGSTNLRLTAGQAARIQASGNIVRATVTQVRAIGGWRDGRLVYQGASWTEVVTDLTRSLGLPVVVSPELGARTFTGVIVLDQDKSVTIRRFAEVIGLTAVREGRGWRLAMR